MIVSGVERIVGGNGGYGRTLRGLAWYIGWPFGKYVEGEGAPDDHHSDEDESNADGSDDTINADEENGQSPTNYGSTSTKFTDPFQRTLTASTSSTQTVRQHVADSPPASPTDHQRTPRRNHGVSFAPGSKSPDETAPLVRTPACHRKKLNRRARQVGRIFYWPAFFLVVAPAMLFVCVICWFCIITIPMAKLTWELLCLLYYRPLELSFRSAPKVFDDVEVSKDGDGEAGTVPGSPTQSVRTARLKKGQVAPTAGPTSTVLLCTYRAVGLQYYKYTVGGVNIMFINLLPLVFFTIFDGIVLLPMVEKAHHEGREVSPILTIIASQALIFVLGLASVIPLSYFLGMAVASISAQSSIGMGAVINATFGSIIEIVLYGIALTQGKGRLVEGSIVGSILAGVLLMPGASMCSGALKRKEQKFNAKSAGVTSTMLIMAIIGTLTPTMFYQTYGSFQIHCEGCPTPGSVSHNPDDAWKCNRCFYEYPEPTTDPFYQHQVKSLMYACAAILLLSYLIGLWFSLRTHASQIWQNPSQVMAKEDVIVSRNALARITPAAVMNPILPVHKAGEHGGHLTPRRSRAPSGAPASPLIGRKDPAPGEVRSPKLNSGAQSATSQPATSQYPQTGYTPLLDSFNPPRTGNMEAIPPLPVQMTQEDFRRAVHTLATAINSNKKQQHPAADIDDGDSGGGHEAPSWTRGVSAAVLISCTLLYAIIAEVLVDVVDVILAGSGIDEKFLGLTLFALVPNTTEFMNAMSFALHGNIALR
jgi:Ca2+:H+ antiporter